MTVRPRPHPFSRSRCILRRSYLRGHVLCVVARLLVRVSRVPREARARTAAGAGAGPDGPWSGRAGVPPRPGGADMTWDGHRAHVFVTHKMRRAACASERGALIQPVISRIQKAKLSWCHPRATSPPVAERAGLLHGQCLTPRHHRLPCSRAQRMRRWGCTAPIPVGAPSRSTHARPARAAARPARRCAGWRP